MPNRDGGKWEGGYVHLEKGRATYYLEREVAGIRYHQSTRCHSRRAALKQLERFEANPSAWRPEGEERAAALRITDELVLEFARHSLAKGNTTKHAREMGRRLADWMEDIGERDLRSLDVRDLKGMLDERRTCRQHRIIAIKSFCAWLRTEKGLLRSAEDPTLDLPVPTASPAKLRRRKAVEHSRVQAALLHLEPAYRDVLLLMAATGWHVSELQRFVRSDESELVGDVAVVRHKSGELHRTALRDHEVLAAAQRLRERRAVPRYLNRALLRACIAAEVEPFGLGVLRHSVATWAVEAGADPATVSRFLGHKDPRTTRRFYVDVAEAPAPLPLPTLRIVR